MSLVLALVDCGGWGVGVHGGTEQLPIDVS